LEGPSAWLKVVPPFFAHEGAVLERLGGGHFPVLLGHDGPRMLLAAIPGDDQYGAALPQLLEMVAILVRLQREWVGRERELLEIGAPDWRAPALVEAIQSVVDRTASSLVGRDQSSIAAFVADLPARFAEIAACGLPDTLVHGDFHPGNVRGDGSNLVLLDWGDCGVGHPLLDETAFLASIPRASIATVRRRWHRLWREAFPGSDPDRAARLLAPIGAVRQAVIYQRFLDNIEPSERPYHQADPAVWLRTTARLARRDS
jgi:Ser/Thr protein kinase RdoA (MazF antagonist)